jgi:energy-coupling factor transporter transmembrane protein EcfT
MKLDRNIETTPSFIERLDPRVKFISLALLTLQVFAFPSRSSLIAASIVVTVAAITARIPILLLLKRLLSVSFFICLIVGINTFTMSGDVLFESLGMYATREGLRQGIVLSTQLVLLLFAATVFVQTTSIPTMIDAIEIALKPVHRHLGPVVQVLAIALNFVPLLIQSAHQIKKAQIARGARIDKNIIRQLRFGFSATIPLFAMTIRSSEHLALAMESRCYDPLVERSHFGILAMKRSDWLTLLLIIAQFVASATIKA